MAGYKPELAFQPYIAPQQQLAVEEFDNLGKTLNERYDKNIAKWDELDAYTNQLQINAQDSGIKDKALSDTRNILKEIREKGNWENAKLQVREVAKRLANDDTITKAQTNFKRLQEQMELESKMKMQGHTLIDFNLGRFNQTTIDPTTGKARILNYDSTEKLQDYDARRKSIFDGVTPDGYDNERSDPTKPDPVTGAIYQVGSGSSAKYISANKIKQIAKNNLDSYLATQEGQQELRVLTSNNSMNGRPLSTEEAKKEVLERLTNTGLTRTFSQTGSKKTMSYSGSIATAANSGAGGGFDGAEEALPITASKVNPLYSNLVDKLTIKERGGMSSIGGGTSGGTGGAGVGLVFNKSQKGFGKLNKTEFKAVENVATSLGIKKQPTGNYSVKDLGRIQAYVKDKQETASAPTYRAFTEEEITKNNNYASNGNLRARGFRDLETGEAIEYKNLPPDVKDALEGKKTGQIQFSGVINSDNYFYDKAKAERREKNIDGWLRPQYITIAGKSYAVTSPSSEMNKSVIDFERTINRISSANRTGVPVRLKSKSNKEYVTSPNPNVRGLYDIRDMDGNLVSQLPIQKVAELTKEGFNIIED